MTTTERYEAEIERALARAARAERRRTRQDPTPKAGHIAGTNRALRRAVATLATKRVADTAEIRSLMNPTRIASASHRGVKSFRPVPPRRDGT